jgi:uncharacterized protein YdeI (YjbR/CyaY-like superfamily)
MPSSNFLSLYKGFSVVEAKDAEQWRDWLKLNHKTMGSVWLVIHKKSSAFESVRYPEAVDEALCFGWIDSLPNKRDADSYYQLFSPRNPKSKWSQVNKNKVAQLLKKGKMDAAGLAMVELAKNTGTWDALNEVDNLQEPNDLLETLKANHLAGSGWQKLAPSLRRGLLEKLLNAKRPETRAKRIEEIVQLALAKS